MNRWNGMVTTLDRVRARMPTVEQAGENLRAARRAMREHINRPIKEDERDLEIDSPKPEGAAPEDNKRFYLGSTIKFVCPECGENCEHDLSQIALSYPPFNQPFEYVCYCEKCGHEWTAQSRLVLHVELAVAKE